MVCLLAIVAMVCHIGNGMSYWQWYVILAMMAMVCHIGNGIGNGMLYWHWYVICKLQNVSSNENDTADREISDIIINSTMFNYRLTINI